MSGTCSICNSDIFNNQESLACGRSGFQRTPPPPEHIFHRKCLENYRQFMVTNFNEDDDCCPECPSWSSYNDDINVQDYFKRHAKSAKSAKSPKRSKKRKRVSKKRRKLSRKRRKQSRKKRRKSKRKRISR